MKSLSIVIPIKDEAESLPELLAEIKAAIFPVYKDFEVIAIDDGSRDNSWEILQKLSKEYEFLKTVRFQYNCGKATALSLGFHLASGRYIATIDGDLQDNPAEIPEMLKMLEGGSDLVSGWKKKRRDPWHKTIPSKFFNLVVSIVCGQRLHDFNCGLKVYKAEVAKSVSLYGDYHRFIPLMASWNGFKIGEKAVEHRARRHGVSKYGVSRLLSGFLDLTALMFLHKFSLKPLHFFGTLGLFACMVASCIFAYFGFEWATTGKLRVRPLLVLAGFAFVSGVQFISLGLLGEMLNFKMQNKDYPVAERTQKST
ncbi:MAG: glycosyltransferase family 2 protein [Fibromonadaceae bacterium]|jgi:glycosyltransferase involved in cell wall biosynthesis|nr:glycosyltransferase family 2 protein [Fibromonadaceae bacterium]